MQHYHYIFTGSGLSALMTVYEMILSGKFDDKTILLLDEPETKGRTGEANPKKSNDRTWCFWDNSSLFDEIVSKKWDIALFADENFQRNLVLNTYQYKMIRGLDFYNLVFDLISKQNNIHFANQKVIDFEELGNHCIVKTDSEGSEQNYTCNKIFNSIYNPNLVKSQSKYPLLQQHFIGWFIKSKEEVFDKNKATFMDFSVEQRGNTRFMYVLPTSSTEALLEYTLFSKDLLSKDEYENEIQKYIQNLGITNYEIVEKEQGNIPMTSYKFWKHNTKNIIHIGSVGGWTKASTGYTFKNTTKKSKALIQFLSKESDTSTSLSTNFRKFHKMDKFWFYDLLFLDVLFRRNDLGSKVFSALFKKGNPTLIFKFLDEETSFWEDLQVIWKCPKGLFIRALFGRIF
ncbi:lycopene cyclase family protein [Flavobacterium sp.]|uniref:lycopene cyclase family protein n=1 Tax=Flavobacterium sp. TaxID=239 RepID=UPI00261F87C7|nr:lycopene cyclase family protein [Flavobacterium sp.]